MKQKQERRLVYAKNINDSGSGVIDISRNPPELYCYCNAFIAEEIFNNEKLLSQNNELLECLKAMRKTFSHPIDDYIEDFQKVLFKSDEIIQKLTKDE